MGPRLFFHQPQPFPPESSDKPCWRLIFENLLIYKLFTVVALHMTSTMTLPLLTITMQERGSEDRHLDSSCMFQELPHAAPANQTKERAKTRSSWISPIFVNSGVFFLRKTSTIHIELLFWNAPVKSSWTHVSLVWFAGATPECLGNQHPSPNVKSLCNFEPQIWPEVFTSCDVESTCFKGPWTSCDVISFGIFWANFGQKRSHQVMDASCPNVEQHVSSTSSCT